MDTAMKEACSQAVRLLDKYSPVEILWERYTERAPHPAGQEGFNIRARLPWQRAPQTLVMVEITVDEKILKPCARRPVLHDYGEPLEAEVLVYLLEEIVAEKLRAILQHVEALRERGWSRSRARDYYDLWRILGAYRERLDVSDFPSFLREKCLVRNVAFTGPEAFFQDPMLAYVEKTWQQWLGPLVPGLPPFRTVIGELRPQIAILVRAEK